MREFLGTVARNGATLPGAMDTNPRASAIETHPRATTPRPRSRIRRVATWTALIAVPVALACVAVAAYGGWSPVGGHAPAPADLLPPDVDIALRLDRRALASSPLLRDPELVALVSAAADFEVADLIDERALGDEVAAAMRLGAWVAVVRVTGPLQGLRLGVARIACRTSGAGPVLEFAAPGGATFFVARHLDVWIVSDEEELAEDTLACALGNAARLSARADLLSGLEPAGGVSAWLSADAGPYLVGALAEALTHLDDTVPAALFDARGACAATLAAPADARTADLHVTWTVARSRTFDRSVSANLATVAARIEEAAANAPRSAAVSDPSDAIGLRVELARAGLEGDALQAELARRLEARRLERAESLARTARDEARRTSAVLRLLGSIEVRLAASDGVARWESRVGDRAR